MRGMQLNCYLLPTDLEQLELALRRSVPFIAASGFAADGTVRRLPTLAVETMGVTPLRIYLVPEWLGAANVRLSEAVRGAPHVDVTEVPVVEFDRCYSDTAIVRRGRLYAVQPRPLDDGDDKFNMRYLHWVKTLFAAARKALIRQADGTYIGAEAKRAFEAGELQLVEM